jgi:hypothetical protein
LACDVAFGSVITFAPGLLDPKSGVIKAVIDLPA